MGLFSIFKNPRALMNRDVVWALPLKFITRFEDRDENDIKTDIMLDSSNLAGYKLLHYQQQAYTYLECTVYYDENLEDIYYQIQRIRDDKVIYETDFHKIKREVFENLAKRTGRKISV